MRSAARASVLLAVLLVGTGCATTSEEPSAGSSERAPTSEPVVSPTHEWTTTPTPTPRPEPASPSPISASDFDREQAVRVVRHLSGRVGPRLATGPGFRRAARWTARELRALGYDVRREPVAVPAGNSWGVPVAAGTSANVVAEPLGFDPRQPHLVVGAHLDTVAVSPGAEDNASGVAVLLAAAAATAERTTRLPVVWVAFGAEEPRGPGDDDHHYGSRAHVARMSPAQRRALRAMVSLDRVGVGRAVPVGSAGASDPVQQGLLAAADRAGVAALPDRDSRSSDHWSFVRAGLPAARLGSTSYAAYHSAADTPDVVDPAQLVRTGRLLLEWLAPR